MNEYPNLKTCEDIKAEKEKLKLQISEKEQIVKQQIQPLFSTFTAIKSLGGVVTDILKIVPWYQSFLFGFKVISSLISKRK